MTTPTVETPAPTAVPLPAHPWVACDAHAEPTTQALYDITTPGGGHLAFCGHHAYKHFGVLEHTWLHGEAKTKGSDH